MSAAADAPLTMRAKGELEIDKLFRQLIKHKGSDLHLHVDKPPILRIKGTLRELRANASTAARLPTSRAWPTTSGCCRPASRRHKSLPFSCRTMPETAGTARL